MVAFASRGVGGRHVRHGRVGHLQGRRARALGGVAGRGSSCSRQERKRGMESQTDLNRRMVLKGSNGGASVMGGLTLSEMEVSARKVVATAMAGSAEGLPVDDNGAAGNQEGELLEQVRAILFYAVSVVIATPIFFFMIAIAPFVYIFDKYRRDIYGYLNTFWAFVSSLPFYKVEIEGRENMLPSEAAAVYVANHQSFLDIYSMFHLNRSFKYISKLSNFVIPIIGWSMFLTGHVPLQRMDRKSQVKCLKQCVELLKEGSPLIFFPEGTRSKDQKLQPFKKGAFAVAVKAGVPVVPVTLVGTGALMPSGQEGLLKSGSIKVIVHPAIAGTDTTEMMEQAREAIASAL